MRPVDQIMADLEEADNERRLRMRLLNKTIARLCDPELTTIAADFIRVTGHMMVLFGEMLRTADQTIQEEHKHAR